MAALGFPLRRRFARLANTGVYEMFNSEWFGCDERDKGFAATVFSARPPMEQFISTGLEHPSR